jgi:RNA polymerase sigma factor for flagellar operon FliA
VQANKNELASSRNQLRNQLIADHSDIARRIALKVARRCPDWVQREDLIAAGMLGLIEAALRYDETRTEPFLSFAEQRIRGAVLDELRRGDIMPRRARAMARKIGNIIRELERLHSTVTDELVAEQLGVSVETYRNDLEGLVHVTIGALDNTEESSLASEDRSPEQDAAKRQAMTRVRAALPTLDQRDLLVLGLYYNEELTYSEIGQVLGVTTSRVCQLHGRAIACLKVAIEGKPVEEDS